MDDFQSHDFEPFARVAPCVVAAGVVQVRSSVSSLVVVVVQLVASFDPVVPYADAVSLDMAVNCVAVD